MTQNHNSVSWIVIIGAVILSTFIGIYSVIFPENDIGKKGFSDNLIIIGLIFDIAGVTVILIPDLYNRVKNIGKKGIIVVIGSKKVGSVDRYRYLARGFFLLVIGFTIQIIGNLLSD